MLEVFSLSALTIDAFWSPNYKIVFNFALLCLRMKESNSNFGAGCPNWAVWDDLRFGFVHSTDILKRVLCLGGLNGELREIFLIRHLVIMWLHD